MNVTRRQLLKVLAISTAGGVVSLGCEPQPGPREFLMQSPVFLPEDALSEAENWYATVCQQCGAGCGIIARVVEGRAKKLEGNPLHPVTGGRLCVRGQAALQGLYHPDRLRGPQRSSGERGGGHFEAISWDDGLNELVSRLRNLRGGGQASGVLLVTEPLRGHRALIVDRFVRTLGGTQQSFDPSDQFSVRAATQRVFGQDRLPVFDIWQSKYLLSFGADFLHTWLSPVWYARAYGDFRRRAGGRGHFVQIEPRLSATAASADEWVPVRPGSEGMLALSLAQVIVAEGLGDRTAASALGGVNLDDYRPDRVAAATGVSAERIAALARAFASQRPSLAIAGGPAAGHSNGTFNLAAVFALNYLVGSVGVAGGVKFSQPLPLPDLPDLAAAPFGEWERLANEMKAGRVSLLMVHGANPVYGLPKAVDFADAVRKVPYVVSFSSFLDETAAQADLILPAHHFLEDWGDGVPEPAPDQPVLGLQQPVVNPLYDTRGFADVLLGVANQLGDDFRRALPWGSLRAALREGVQKLPLPQPQAPAAAAAEVAWNRLLQAGGWYGSKGGAQPAARPQNLPAAAPPDFAGAEKDYPFNLIVFESPTLGDGRFAHLPWLQAAPDPVTTVVWRTWVEVNPQKAKEMGLAAGDVVAVESPAGRVEAPVYLQPGVPAWAVAMPTGQGHTAYTQYASGRGVNPLDLLAPDKKDKDSGALATAATRVRLSRTGRNMRLAKKEGAVKPVQLEEVPIVQVTRE